jgi:hypothetical protein
MKNKDESDSSSSPKKLSFNQKYQANEISKTKPIKFKSSSSMINETARDNINSSELTKQSSLPLEKNSKSNIHSTPERLPMNQTPNSVYETLSTTESSNISPRITSKMLKSESNSMFYMLISLSILEQEFLSEKKKSGPHSNLDNLTTDKSPIYKKTSKEMLNDQTKTHPSSFSPLNDKTAKLNPTTTDEKLNEIFTLTKQKLQPTLDALQDKKDELLSAIKNSPDSSISNEYSKKSKSVSLVNTDVPLDAIKQQQQQTKNKSFKTIQSPETDRIKTAVNNGIDSDIKSKTDEVVRNSNFSISLKQ